MANVSAGTEVYANTFAMVRVAKEEEDWYPFNTNIAAPAIKPRRSLAIFFESNTYIIINRFGQNKKLIGIPSSTSGSEKYNTPRKQLIPPVLRRL